VGEESSLDIERFWLYEWLDNVGARSYRQAERLLRDPVALADLRERAASVPYTTEKLRVNSGSTIIAGRAIDLSGDLDCLAWNCMQAQVDHLFNRVWHYFDRVVVVGPSAHEISRAFEAESGLPRHLPAYVRLLLYLREIGAEELLVFRQRRPPCQDHLKDHLREVGIEDAEAEAERAIPQLAKEAKLQLHGHNDHIHYAFSHPQFEHTVWGSIRSDTDGDLSQAVARSVVRKYLASLASDLYTAKVLNSPLGSTVRFHTQLLATRTVASEAGALAFQLELPVLNGVDPRTLLKIRNDERPTFDRFRRALTKALEDRLANISNTDTTNIVNEIRQDVLEPALGDIEMRLKAATGVLARKATASIGIAGLPTIFGLYMATPLLVAVGLGAAVNTLINATHKYFEEKRDVALSDMFFLWEVQQHALKHAA
jgi:hypothetical protein